MTLDEFIAKWSNKQCDYDGAYGTQCMDVWDYYCKEVLGLEDSYIRAYLFASGPIALYKKELEAFEKINNTPLNYPKKGDVLIFGPYAGEWGHIVIVTEANPICFKSFEANWPLGSYPHIEKHSYKGVLGWLRFKGGDIPMKGIPFSGLVDVLDGVEGLRARDLPKVKGSKVIYKYSFKDNPIHVISYIKGDLIEDKEMKVASSIWYEDDQGNWFNSAYTNRPDPNINPNEEVILPNLKEVKIMATQVEKDAKVAELEAAVVSAEAALAQLKEELEAVKATKTDEEIAKEAKQAELEEALAKVAALKAELGVE